MICPFCGSNHDRVIDSRPTEGGQAIRRRRECLACTHRYSTYERVEQSSRLMVIKRDGTRVPFDVEKILSGMNAAIGKRGIAEDDKRRIAREIEEELHLEFDREVSSGVVGERVMARLRERDPVSYLRFAIEQRGLESVHEIMQEVTDLLSRPAASPDEPRLFVASVKEAR